MTRLLHLKMIEKKDNSVSMHCKNIQVLISKMFRIDKGISSKIMMEDFLLSQPSNYNIRHQPDFSIRPVNLVYYVTGLNLAKSIWDVFVVCWKSY